MRNRFKRINVNKIILIKDLYNKPISKLELTLDRIEQFASLDKLEIDGNTEIILNVKDNQKTLKFKLNRNRKVDRNSINLLKKDGIRTQIN